MSAPITRQLDVTGTFCPLPILLAVREMVQLAAGDRLEVVGDDPGILEDMPIWCERAGHRLIEISEREGKIISIVEKGGQVPSPRKRRGKVGGGGAGGEGGADGGGGAGGEGDGGGGARGGGAGGGAGTGAAGGGGAEGGGTGGGDARGGDARGESATADVLAVGVQAARVRAAEVQAARGARGRVLAAGVVP